MEQSSEYTVALSIPSVLGYEKVVMETAAAIGREMGFSQDRVDDLRTAVSEACLNAIEHGNKQDISVKVLVTFIPQASRLQVEVADQGSGITEKPEPPRIEDKMAGEDDFRGWGLFLIERLVDEVAFEQRPEGGHTTRLIINFET